MDERESRIHPYDLHVGRYGPQLAQGLIRSAGVTRRDRVLDVGCGTGQLAAKLAELVGADGVSGIDPNEAVVAVARRRVPGTDIRIGSAEALPFADQRVSSDGRARAYVSEATEGVPVDSKALMKGRIPGELRRPTQSFGRLRHA